MGCFPPIKTTHLYDTYIHIYIYGWHMVYYILHNIYIYKYIFSILHIILHNICIYFVHHIYAIYIYISLCTILFILYYI